MKNLILFFIFLVMEFNFYLFKKKTISSLIFIISFVLFLLGIIFSNLHKESISKTDNEITDLILKKTDIANSEMMDQFNLIKRATLEIEQQIVNKKLTEEQIRQVIKDAVETTQGAYRAGIAFKHNRFKEHALFSPYYQKGAKNNPNQTLSQRYDYTQSDSNTGNKPRTFWFHQPLEQGPMWLAPYFGLAANNWLSEFVRPFRANYDDDKNNGYDGVIYMNLSLSGLSKITSKLKLEDSGFAFILSDQNKLMAYPDKQWLGQPLMQIKGLDINLKTILKQGKKSSISRFIHPINQKESWVIFKPILNSRYTLGIIVWAEEVRENHHIPKLFPYDTISYLAFISSILILIAAIRFPKTHTKALYRLSLVMSLILVISLTLVSYEELNKDISQLSPHQVYERVNVNNLLLKQGYASRYESQLIPFQITLSSINFTSPSSIQIIGRLKLNKVSVTQTEPPIFFPMAFRTQWERIDEIDTQWKFTTSIKQPFDYASFPFDKEKISLLIQVKNQYKQSLLVPDFKRYPSMSPSDLPGIAQKVVRINGWSLEGSYFNYVISEDDIEGVALNLIIKRNLIGPLITYLLPILMILSLAYFTLLMWTKERDMLILWGFSFSSVLARSSSLFFILILSHISLREALEAKGIIFLEFYYLASYSLLICVTISSMLYLANNQNPVINYQNGLILKLIYWPYFLLFCLITSLIQL
jgi:hypothetical protein